MRPGHFCNTLACPVCVRAFWKWAENHTRGRTPRQAGGPSFYEAAAKFWDKDARSKGKTT